MISHKASALVVLLLSVLLNGAPLRVMAESPPLGARIVEDFRNGQFETARWKLLTPAELTKPEVGGLLIEIPENAGAVPSAGIAGRFGLRGDFEMTAEFELVNVPTP